MRILEIKNSLVKISYEVEENLALANFVIIEDKNTPYVAQVVNLKAENGRNYAVLRLLFTFNEEGVLKPYDGTIPSVEASVTKLPVEELLEVLPVDFPVYLGSIANQETPFKLDSSVFESNMLICSNSVENSSKMLSNILPQLVDFGKKVVLLDVNGDFSSPDNFVFGKDFELPLNKQFLEFIFENDLDGVAPVSKAVIQDIFREVEDYIDTLPQGYLPIDLFINVVQEQYKETGIPELVLLKNKLLNYQEQNVFAATGDDVAILRDKIAHSDMLVVDVSNVDVKLQKRLIPYMFDCISTINANTFVLMTINNEVADKRLLRKTLEFNNIYTTIVCPHEFKYLPDLKQIIQNLILFAPQTVQHDFANYNTFLSKLNSDECVVYGPSTQNIPFVIQLKPYEELDISSVEDGEEVQEADNFDDVQQVVEENSLSSDFSGVESEAFVEANDYIEAEIVKPDVFVDDIEAEKEFMRETILGTENNETVSDAYDTVEQVEQTEFFDENSEETGDDVSMEEAMSFEQQAYEEREMLEEQVAQDVDAAFYKKFEEETLTSEDEINPEILIDNEPVEELSDNDLDYIQSMPIENVEEDYSTEDFVDDFSNEPVMDDLEAQVMDESSIDELQVDNSVELIGDDVTEPQMVPVYTPDEFADDSENVADLYQAGDVVSHPKYGQGVVEKMINYGNKTLCSISFVNIGRRLLDPSLSELTLLSRDGAIIN